MIHLVDDGRGKAEAAIPTPATPEASRPTSHVLWLSMVRNEDVQTTLENPDIEYAVSQSIFGKKGLCHDKYCAGL